MLPKNIRTLWTSKEKASTTPLPLSIPIRTSHGLRCLVLTGAYICFLFLPSPACSATETATYPSIWSLGLGLFLYATNTLSLVRDSLQTRMDVRLRLASNFWKLGSNYNSPRMFYLERSNLCCNCNDLFCSLSTEYILHQKFVHNTTRKKNSNTGEWRSKSCFSLSK